MEIFSNFEKKCDEIDDSLKSKLYYKMTICYYSNLSKIKSHFPKWKIRIKVLNILEEIIEKNKQIKSWQ
jgi:hypothetical protein